MKNQKMMQRGYLRLLLLLLSVLTVLTLVGCRKNGSYDTAIRDDDTAVTYFARIIPLDAEVREKFVAAYRGYDMTVEKFEDPSLENSAAGVPLVDVAKKILNNDALCPDGDENRYDAFRAELDADKMGEIVTKMQTEVDLGEKNGPIDTLLVWIGKFVDILTRLTGGIYVLGLFLFAIVVEVLMLPFGIKQQKTSIKQAKMRPKEMAIRKKYAGRNDQVTQQKMTQEIQKMYQEEGFNPMGGCLPLLIQLPIIMALYNIVINPLRYVLGMSANFVSNLTTYCTTARAAGGLGISLSAGKGTIELLDHLNNPLATERLKSFLYFSNGEACANALPSPSALPNLKLFGVINTAEIPSLKNFNWLLLVPVLTFVFYFFSMKLTRKFSYQPQSDDPQVGCSNKMMDLMMPAMSVYIAFIVPAAVGIYWIFKSIISTLKQFILHKAMPMPVFTEEDYKAAERALKGKPEKKSAPERTAAPGGKVVRSLHHIDDDDEPLPPPGQVDFEKIRREAAEKKAAEEAARKAEEENKSSAVPNLKEDRKNDKTDKNDK